MEGRGGQGACNLRWPNNPPPGLRAGCITTNKTPPVLEHTRARGDLNESSVVRRGLMTPHLAPETSGAVCVFTCLCVCVCINPPWPLTVEVGAGQRKNDPAWNESKMKYDLSGDNIFLTHYISLLFRHLSAWNQNNRLRRTFPPFSEYISLQNTLLGRRSKLRPTNKCWSG